MNSDILVILTGGLGDALISIPVIERIKLTHPESKLHLLYEQKGSATASKDAIAHLNLFEKYIPIEKCPRTDKYKGKLNVFFQLRRENYTHAYYITSCTRSDKTLRRDRFYFRLCGVSSLHGFNSIPQNEMFPVSDDGKPIQTKHELFWRLKRLHMDTSDSLESIISNINYKIPKTSEQEVDTLLHGHEEEIAAIMLQSGNVDKDWPIDRFIAVTKHLKDNGMLPVFMGAASQHEAASKLISTIGSGLNACGQLSFTGSAAMIRKSRLYIGPDSCLSHLAGMFGTPSVILFSNTNHPGQWHPISVNNSLRILQGETQPSKPEKQKSKWHRSMEAISEAEVIESIQKVIDPA